MFEETKKLIDHAQSNNNELNDLADQRSTPAPMARRILAAAIGIAALAALVLAAILSGR